MLRRRSSRCLLFWSLLSIIRSFSIIEHKIYKWIVIYIYIYITYWLLVKFFTLLSILTFLIKKKKYILLIVQRMNQLISTSKSSIDYFFCTHQRYIPFLSNKKYQLIATRITYEVINLKQHVIMRSKFFFRYFGFIRSR